MITDIKEVEKPMLLGIADKLVLAQREIDELTLQLALGKAEAREKFEELKKDFYTRLSTIKHYLKSERVSEISKEITARIDDLELRLQEGKVESKEMFLIQKKQLLKSMVALEKEIRGRLPESLSKQNILHELETFKLKMEIVRLRFELKRFVIKDSIRSNINEVNRRVEVLVKKAKDKVNAGKKKITEMKKGVTSAYHQLEKSFS
jgi:hypothetical protein